MTYSQPEGYRVPSRVSLTSVSRALEHFGWPLWRTEVVRAVAAVAGELLAARNGREQVYQKLSRNQITESDLVISLANGRGLLHRAAEFLDVGHGLMHRPSALPLPPRLDLRCRAQFMDDRNDPERAWTYILFGTEHQRLEDAFLQLRGIEPYPLPVSDLPLTDPDADPDLAARAAVWARVLAPYARSSPLSLSAPEPQITFDIAESLRRPDKDAQYAAEGKTTVTAVIAEIAGHLGDDAPPDLREQLTAQIER